MTRTEHICYDNSRANRNLMNLLNEFMRETEMISFSFQCTWFKTFDVIPVYVRVSIARYIEWERLVIRFNTKSETPDWWNNVSDNPQHWQQVRANFNICDEFVHRCSVNWLYCFCICSSHLKATLIRYALYCAIL